MIGRQGQGQPGSSVVLRPGTLRTSHCVSRRHRGMTEAQPLRLNPTRTQVMWLGSPQQQLAKIDISELPVASTRINVSEKARDLGQSVLSLSAQVAAVCRSGYYQLWQLRPLVRSVNRDHKDAGLGIYFVSSGLLQLCFTASLRV